MTHQSSRDAAADILDLVSGLIDHNGIGQVADLIRDGEYDEHDVMRLIAAHRATVTAEIIDNEQLRLTDLWHNHPTVWEGASLPELLGMNEAEYGLWMSRGVDPKPRLTAAELVERLTGVEGLQEIELLVRARATDPCDDQFDAAQAIADHIRAVGEG